MTTTRPHADSPAARTDRRVFSAETSERLAWLLDSMTRDLRTERHARRKASLTRQAGVIRELLAEREAAEAATPRPVPAAAPALAEAHELLDAAMRAERLAKVAAGREGTPEAREAARLASRRRRAAQRRVARAAAAG